MSFDFNRDVYLPHLRKKRDEFELLPEGFCYQNHGFKENEPKERDFDNYMRTMEKHFTGRVYQLPRGVHWDEKKAGYGSKDPLEDGDGDGDEDEDGDDNGAGGGGGVTYISVDDKGVKTVRKYKSGQWDKMMEKREAERHKSKLFNKIITRLKDMVAGTSWSWFYFPKADGKYAMYTDTFPAAFRFQYEREHGLLLLRFVCSFHGRSMNGTHSTMEVVLSADYGTGDCKILSVRSAQSADNNNANKTSDNYRLYIKYNPYEKTIWGPEIITTNS